ncbi:MAG: exodeoxyribonuclease VII large subunit, partial [Planctomycetota bacterium]
MARRPFDPSLARGGLFGDPSAAEQAKPAEKPAEKPALSVSQAAELLKGTLMGLGRVRIQGEVGQAGGGTHCYFTLKDESSTVNCVMWASTLSRSAVKPEQGVEVIVEGTFDYYGPSGRLSLIVDRMRHVGEGDLEARFRALCNELRGLGWFDEARKRPLPLVPRGVAIVTAPGSAALADCLKIAATRFPSVPLTVIGVKVQGSDAAAEVVRAIERVNAAADTLGVEVIIVTRGGGSREDLQAFNERAVAEAAFRSRLPLVAAIGHESDTSVIELVADLRASTPTQAMVAVLPDRRE